MASPQVENGYTRIANELMDALCTIRVPGEARQVFDVILRKTYGYGKKSDKISLSQLQKATGLNRGNVCRATRTLLAMKMIVRTTDGTHLSTYSINKNHDEWGVESKATLPKLASNMLQTSVKDAHKLESEVTPTIEINKTTKEITTNVVRGNPDVNEGIRYLLEKTDLTKLDGSEQQNRRYMWLCLKKFDPSPPRALQIFKYVVNCALDDPFHRTRCTEVKYIYYNAAKIARSKQKTQIL